MQSLAAGKNQFELSLAWSMRSAGRRRFHQRESDRLFSGGNQLPPPPVERMLAELTLAAKRANGLAAVLLLCDSLDLSPKLRQPVKSQISANGEFDLWGCRDGSSQRK